MTTVEELAAELVARMRKVYNAEYMAALAVSEPESMIGITVRLEAALAQRAADAARREEERK